LRIPFAEKYLGCLVEVLTGVINVQQASRSRQALVDLLPDPPRTVG
jgi:hypothetical protein